MASSSENLRGALLTTFCMGAFASNDALMRFIAGEIPVSQAIFIRGVVTSLLLLVLLVARRRSLFLPRGQALRTILIRSGAEAGTGSAVILSLYHMPLSIFTAIAQAAPLCVALAGTVFLSEPIGWRRLLAIAVGFVGVIIIIRPGTAGFSPWSFCALLAVALLTLRDISSRRIPVSIPPAVPAFAGSVTITGCALIWGMFSDWGAVPPDVFGVLILAGGFLVMAYLLAIAAMRVGEIGFVAPFRYMALVWALLIGFTLLGERMDGLTMIGVSIVVGSGGYSLWREIARRKTATMAMTR